MKGIGWMVSISKYDEPVTERDAAEEAAEIFGMKILEAEEAECGIWIAEISDRMARRMKIDGFIEMWCKGYTLNIEMP